MKHRHELSIEQETLLLLGEYVAHNGHQSASAAARDLLDEYAKGAWRKSQPIESTAYRLKVWADDEVWDMASERAQFEGISISEAIRELLTAWSEANTEAPDPLDQ